MGFKGPIGLTVQFIKQQLGKRGDAGSAERSAVPPTSERARGEDVVRQSGLASGAGGEGEFAGPVTYAVKATNDQLNKCETTAAGEAAKGGFDSVPLDEEGFGQDGSPDKTGIPRDPEKARSKRLATLAIMAMGFGLAVDFAMSLMSIQPLYYILQGPQNIYGLTFGSYDLTAMIFAPLFGYWTDVTTTFKLQIAVGAVVNAIGNLLYGFVFLADRWWVMLVARAIAGVGAATLGIGSSYITQTTTSARRQIVLGRYRVTQNLARMIGPFVGYLFIGLPNVNQGSSTGLKLFNWYTIPGWAAFLLVAVLLAVFVWWFVDPTDQNEHRAHAVEDLPPATPQRTAEFRSFTIQWLLLSFLAIFSFSGYTANLFALFAGQFHGVNTQGDNWKTYIGVGIGAAVGASAFRRMIKWAPQWWEERKLCLASSALLCATWMLVIPYGGATSSPPDALYYASTGLAGFTVVINQASLETVFSKKVTQYADVVRDNVGKMMGAYFMAASAGRFAGPLVVAGVTHIATPSGQTNYCTDWVMSGDGSYTCNGPPAQQCAITGDEYYVEGCVLYNAIPMLSVMAGLQVLIGLGLAAVLWKHWSYDSVAAPAPHSWTYNAAAAGAAPESGTETTGKVADAREL